MTLKKDTLGTASAKSLTEAFRCGECLHFKVNPHPSRKKICSLEGIRAFAVAPQCFTPDVTQVAKNSDEFAQLAALFSSYNSKQKRILLGMLRQKPTKAKLEFGMKVFFRAMGDDYISNYLAGYVMGYTSSGDLMLTGSPDQNARGRSFIAYLKDTEHLLDAVAWRAKKEELKASGKIFDPHSKIKRKRELNLSEPPTIDNAPTDWYNGGKKRKSKEMLMQVGG